MIKSVQKATKILSVLADKGDEAVSLSAISQKTQINKSTCSHIIATLEAEGYVVKRSGSKGYILGPAVYCLAGASRYKNHLITICRPIMQYLYKKLGYCVVLAVIENGTKYVVDSIDNGTFFDRDMRIREDNIYCTATGRIIMQYMSDEEVCEIYRKCGVPAENGWIEICSLDELLEKTHNVKKDEIVVTRHTGRDGVNIGYGVALFDGGGCVGAIGIAVNILDKDEKMLDDEDEKIKKLLIKAGKEINRRLSYK